MYQVRSSFMGCLFSKNGIEYTLASFWRGQEKGGCSAGNRAGALYMLGKHHRRLHPTLLFQSNEIVFNQDMGKNKSSCGCSFKKVGVWEYSSGLEKTGAGFNA
jgi:hypothetical protein